MRQYVARKGREFGGTLTPQSPVVINVRAVKGTDGARSRTELIACGVNSTRN